MNTLLSKWLRREVAGLTRALATTDIVLIPMWSEHLSDSARKLTGKNYPVSFLLTVFSAYAQSVNVHVSRAGDTLCVIKSGALSINLATFVSDTDQQDVLTELTPAETVELQQTYDGASFDVVRLLAKEDTEGRDVEWQTTLPNMLEAADIAQIVEYMELDSSMDHLYACVAISTAFTWEDLSFTSVCEDATNLIEDSIDVETLDSDASLDSVDAGAIHDDDLLDAEIDSQL